MSAPAFRSCRPAAFWALALASAAWTQAPPQRSAAPTWGLGAPKSARAQAGRAPQARWGPRPPTAKRPPRLAAFAQLPLAFVPAADGRSFVAQGPGYTLALRSSQATLALGKGHAFRLRLQGARAAAPHPADRLASVSNEYIGNDRRRWRTHLPNYGEVQFRRVYPGIGLRYYGHQGQLEADFLLAAGADPARIRLAFPGAPPPRLAAAGALRLGAVTLGAPHAFQTIHGRRRPVPAHYVLQGRRARIRLGPYDRTRPLVIDPTLSYSYNAPGGYSTLTGLGRAFGLYLDAAGDPILIASAGDTCGDPTDALNKYCTVAIWKFNPQGTQVLWRSSLAGPNGEYEFASGIDPSGGIYIGGSTDAPSGFPTTAGVIQPTPSGPGIRSYLAKFSPNGALLYSTLLGSGDLELYAVTGDANGDAFVAGSDKVSDLDVPPLNSLPAPCAGGAGNCFAGFVEEINPTASDYLYGTYFGGSGLADANGAPYYLIIGAIAVDGQGHIYIGGQNLGFPDLPTVNAFEPTCQPNRANDCLTGFLAELNPAVAGVNGLMFSDYLLGQPSALLLDQASPPNLYVAGVGGPDPAFPTQHLLGLANSIFVAKIPTATPAQPTFQTLFDGNGGMSNTELGGVGFALDPAGDLWVGGATGSGSPPFALMNPISPTCPSGSQAQPECDTGFVSEASPDGASLLFSTYLGGSSTYPTDTVAALAADASGNIYAAGTAASSDFPVTPSAYYSTCCGAFLAKLAPQPAPTAPTVAISPGSLATSFVGGEAITQIVVTNTATAGSALLVNSVTATDPSSDYSVYPNIAGSDGHPSCYYYQTNTPDPVPPGGSCDISVYWFPAQTTPDPLSVAIFDNAANIVIPQLVAYAPTALNGPQASPAPGTPIGDILQGNQGVETVTLTNTGNAALVLSSFGLGGSPDFAFGANTCAVNTSIYPRGSCSFTIVYTANGAPNIPETATLTLNDNSISPPGPTQLVPLSATTTPLEPLLAISPSSDASGVSFPTTAQGTPSGSIALQVQNQGSAPLLVGSLGLAGANAADFHESDNCASTAVPVYGSCTVTLFLQPSLLGPENASLSIASNDPATPLLALPLTGMGGAPLGLPTSLPVLVSLDNEAPPQPSSLGANTSAASSGGQFVAFTSGGGYAYGPGNNLPGPTSSVQGIAGLYLRNTCNGPNAPSTCSQATQFIAYGPSSGPFSNGGAACLNQQATFTQGAQNPQISSDGRFVAFEDDACPLSNNGSQQPVGQVYLRDLQANGGLGATTAVTNASGSPLLGFFAMSADARFFAYSTSAASTPELLATDTATPADVLVSQSNNGTPDAGTTLSLPSLSPDGRFVAFASDFDDVNGAAGNGFLQVYLRDTCLGAPAGCTPNTRLVSSPNATATPASGGSSGAGYFLNGTQTPGIAVSAGGRYVVFTSNAPDLPQPPLGNGAHPVEVYLRDTCQSDGAPLAGCSSTTTLLSAAVDGTTPNGDSLAPQISADGRIITFQSQGTLEANAPVNALYSYDTCLSNGQPVNSTPACQPGLQGVVSLTQTSYQGVLQPITQVAASQFSLDPSGQFATYTGPPFNCTTCFQVWLNPTHLAVPAGVVVPLVALTASPATPGVGQNFSYTISATNAGSANATDVTVADTLPASVAFVSAAAGCVQASGVVTCDLGPLAAGASASATLTVTAPNQPGATLLDSASLATGSQANLALQTSLSNSLTLPAPPSITTLAVPAATVGQAFSALIATSGGLAPVAVNLASGNSLPPWLALAHNTLSGTPTASGSFAFSLVATDASGSTSAPQAYTLAIGCPPIGLTAAYVVQTAATPPVPATLPATAGVLLPAVQFAAVLPLNTTLPVTFSASGNLDGLAFDPATAILSGAPIFPGTYPFSVNASGGGCTATALSFTLVVAPPPPLALPPILEAIHVADNLGSPNTLISAVVIPPIAEAVHASDTLGSPNTLISALVIPPIAEAVHASDTLGPPNSLISALVIPPIAEAITVSDSPAPTACAVAATGITIKLGGYFRRFGTTLYSQTVTLTNTGATPVGPLFFVVDDLQGATLQSPSGATACAPPLGSPYLLVPGPLAPGASVNLILHFNAFGAIHYAPRLLIGGKP